MRKIFFSIFLFTTLVLVGCGGSQHNLPGTDVGDMPDWFLNPPTDPNFLYAAKTESSRDMQMALDKAANSGRAEIARQVEVKMSALEKQFKEEVGEAENSTMLQQFTQATKSVTNQSLNGSRIKEQKLFQDGNTWRAYVLVEYPIGAANVQLMEAMKKNQEMYTRFRSTQTFEELDKEIQKLEGNK